MRYILDACAFLAFLNDEEGGDAIEKLLMQSVTGGVSVSMSIVNLLEVYYAELREKGSDIAQIVIEIAHHYTIEIVNTISEKVFHEAARLKATYRMSLGDCIGIATALDLSGQFVTSDYHEIGAIAKDIPSLIFWYR